MSPLDALLALPPLALLDEDGTQTLVVPLGVTITDDARIWEVAAVWAQDQSSN